MSEPLSTPMIPVSWGELIDKLTILRLKSENLQDPRALDNVRRELALLTALAEPAMRAGPRIRHLMEALGEVNSSLWDIEDRIREKERKADFGPEFVALARAVYRTNDRRAAIKRDLNLALGSELVEEKAYTAY